MDLRAHLDKQRQCPSQEESQGASSKAKSLGESSKDRGAVGQGGHQSSGHHRGSGLQGQGPSSRSMGPPRPPLAATATSGSLEAEASSSSSYAQVAARGANKPQDKGKRAAQQDRSRDHKVCTKIAKVQWGLYVSVANLLGDILERNSIFIFFLV